MIEFPKVGLTKSSELDISIRHSTSSRAIDTATKTKVFARKGIRRTVNKYTRVQRPHGTSSASDIHPRSEHTQNPETPMLVTNLLLFSHRKPHWSDKDSNLPCTASETIPSTVPSPNSRHPAVRSYPAVTSCHRRRLAQACLRHS